MSTLIRLTALVGVLGAFVVGYVYTMGAGNPGISSPAVSNAQEGGSWFDGLFQDVKREVRGESRAVPALDKLKLRESLQGLQVPCGYIISTSEYTMTPEKLNEAPVTPIDTLLDPSSPFSTITKSTVMKDRYLKILYEEGGQSRFIPAGALFLRMGSLEATLRSPEIRVVEDDGAEEVEYPMRLGKDFIGSNQGQIDLDEMELSVDIQGRKVMIPFLQKRSSPLSGSDEL